MRLNVYEPPLTMADDPRLVEVFLPLRKRLWWEQVNWYAVGIIAAVAAVDGLLVMSMLRWIR